MANVTTDTSIKLNAEYSNDSDFRGFPYISEKLHSYLKDKYLTAEAHHKNDDGSDKTSDELERLSHYYRKELTDGTWMSLRIADHEPNFKQTFLSYTRELVPSNNKYANICLMFRGTKETEQDRKRGIKKRTSTSPREYILYISNNEMKKYKPFRYIIYKFIPGLIYNSDVPSLYQAITTWFSKNGKQEFSNPLPTKPYRYIKDDVVKEELMNPLDKIFTTRIEIRNKSIRERNKRKAEALNAQINIESSSENESMVTVLGGKQLKQYKIADIVIMDDEMKNQIGTAELVLIIESVKFDIVGPRPEIKKSDDNTIRNNIEIIDDEELRRLTEDYYNVMREWINSH